MRTALLLATVLLISGCSGVLVKRTFPTAPESLLQECPELAAAKTSEKLSDLLTTVTDNYSTYHECRVKSEQWIKWYSEQKEIFNQVK